ncbi:MAG: RNase adapter RapZ [Candidatus Spyradocola sp.]
MKLVVVTGLSGAGKSQALHTLEDIGFYCVDNLPPMLIPNMAKLCMEDDPAIQRVALGIDTRSGAFFGHADEALDELTRMNVNYDVIYLTASDEELIRRYKETRRAHPMGSEKMLIQNIKKEREMLQGMERRATRVIDTTTMLTRQLREMLLRMYGEGDTDKAISVNVLSFGFKHGIPQDADLVFDVRFIPNPFYIPEMRPMNGADQPVHDYVMSFDETHQFLDKTLDLLRFLIPNYVSEGKDRLVIGIGCTGGQHRSVCLAIEIAEGLRQAGFRSSVSHRDAVYYAKK